MLRHNIINDNIIVLWMYITYPETVVLNIYTETGTIITLCFIPTAAVTPVTITIRTIRVYRTGKVWHVYITWIVKYISNRKQKPFYGNKIWVFFFTLNYIAASCTYDYVETTISLYRIVLGK